MRRKYALVMRENNRPLASVYFNSAAEKQFIYMYLSDFNAKSFNNRVFVLLFASHGILQYLPFRKKLTAILHYKLVY